MKTVTRIDKKGYKIVTKLRDSDNIEYPEMGLPVSIDVRDLNWESIKVELNNILVDSGLYTWSDVMKSQNGITSAILSVMRPKLVGLYRESFRNNNKGDDL